MDSTEESLLGMEAKNHHIMEAVVDGKDEVDMVGVEAEEGFAVDVVDTEVDKLKNHGRKSMEEIVVEEGIVEEVMIAIHTHDVVHLDWYSSNFVGKVESISDKLARPNRRHEFINEFIDILRSVITKKL